MIRYKLILVRNFFLHRKSLSIIKQAKTFAGLVLFKKSQAE
jgi:hypothetical protein